MDKIAAQLCLLPRADQLAAAEYPLHRWCQLITFYQSGIGPPSLQHFCATQPKLELMPEG